jgi:hypothetical protein
MKLIFKSVAIMIGILSMMNFKLVACMSSAVGLQGIAGEYSAKKRPFIAERLF